jgi:hypothetical protein
MAWAGVIVDGTDISPSTWAKAQHRSPHRLSIPVTPTDLLGFGFANAIASHVNRQSTTDH